MKKLIAGLAVVVSLTGCEYVDPGHVGLKVDLLGSDKGVNAEELGVGRYWIGINETLYTFPTFTQNYVWTRDAAEGSPNNESISFQTIDGMSVNADVGISYRIDPDKVSTVFEKYRKGVDEITDVYLRNMVRDALVSVSSGYDVESVYGKGKVEIMQKAQDSVRDQVEDLGIIIEKIYWVGDLRLPEVVINSINAKIQATQKAQQRENEVQQTIAEAEKARQEAKGKADAISIVAKAEAEAIKIRGDAIRKNPSVIQLEAINKWDGVLPRVSDGEAMKIINLSDIAR
jgi:regulator of protease activity HflC (stomatin/prohibitin superfamily)